MLSKQLINHMGLINFQPKNNHTTTAQTPRPIDHISPKTNSTTPAHKIVETAADQTIDEKIAVVKLDKNEFRLLVKMLQAIGHDCVYDNITLKDSIVTYLHPHKTLVFNDITHPDSDQLINLSSLKDLLSKPELKRAVWEKLKTLK